MDTVTKRLYEGMFLVDSASNWDQMTGRIKSLIEKYEGSVTDLRKWDERRLAYEICGKNRGLYILVYFEMPTGMLHEMERDIQLSEDIMRAMVLRTDAMSEEDINRETPAMTAVNEAARESSQDSSDDRDSDQESGDDSESDDSEDDDYNERDDKD